MLPFVGPVLPAEMFHHIARHARRYLEGRAPLFSAWIAGGRICDDLAFLVVDLERLGRSDLATQLIHDYEEFSGVPQPRSLLHHCVAYRALVCAKAACMRGAQGDVAAPQQVHTLLAIAFRHTEYARVKLVLVGGLPGAGRSTLARGLADALDGVVLRAGEACREPDPMVLRRTRILLDHGYSVVLDAGWSARAWRHAARRLARRAAADVCEVHSTAPADPAGTLARALRAVAQGGRR